jgi:cyclopropane fatty-acyl-phospholipid synthase-like methyltransferase
MTRSHHGQTPRYPRASAYDIDWMMDNMMGPNAIWLMESLADRLHLEPGMRLLDMGCGKAISSIFLAREYGVQVWATDLWISATENWDRIRHTDVESLVFPIFADAHALPFAEAFFDTAVDWADMIEEGWRDWLLWVGDDHEDGKALHVDQGRNLGFTMVVARTV